MASETYLQAQISRVEGSEFGKSLHKHRPNEAITHGTATTYSWVIIYRHYWYLCPLLFGQLGSDIVQHCRPCILPKSQSVQ